jgi:hypothetical protein
MPSKRKKPDSAASAQPGRETQVAPPLPPAAVLSFLKETRGTVAWNADGLAKSLNLSAAVAKQVIPFLQAQGYIEATDGGGWLTTVSGDTVSGSRPPRYTPEAVEAALSDLAERIKAANQDASARFRVAKAVALRLPRRSASRPGGRCRGAAKTPPSHKRGGRLGSREGGGARVPQAVEGEEPDAERPALRGLDGFEEPPQAGLASC